MHLMHKHLAAHDMTCVHTFLQATALATAASSNGCSSISQALAGELSQAAVCQQPVRQSVSQ
jgi:hypothetical protein